MKKKFIKLFALMFCFTLMLTACSKAEKDTDYSKTNPTETMTDAPNDESIKESGLEPTATSIPEPTATSTPTATPEPTATPTVTPTATPIPEPTESPYLNVVTGDIITFGSYEQDNDLSNGNEPIEWIVLSNDGEKILVLSKYALDCQRYNTAYTEITWENCTLRSWLNNDFYNSAFSDTEKIAIINSYIENHDNQEYGTEGGNDTYDNIFLLSLSDMIKTEYGFSSDYNEFDVVRRCAPTVYAAAQGVWVSDSAMTSDGDYACWWSLRSPGYNPLDAANVDVEGLVHEGGGYVDYWDGGVRPALYIRLKP